MAIARVTFHTNGLAKHAQRLQKASARTRQVLTRSVATVSRRLGPEAARAVSEEVLNLPVRTVRPYISVERREARGQEYLSLLASRTRLPLLAYRPRFSRTDGVTVTTWRDSGPRHLPHAFKRRDKPGVWERIPAKNVGKFRPAGRSRADQTAETPSGLVARLPIVQRKGPSLHRVFQNNGPRASHVDLRPRLSRFVEQTLSREIARQLRAQP